MAKDEHFLVFALIITLLDVAFGLYLSQTSLIKNLDETFLVVCRDEGGQSVMWRGPKGTALNARTHPMVQHASYGTSILFNKTRMEDTGNYTCILSGSPQVRKVFSLAVQDIKTTTQNPSKSDPNKSGSKDDDEDDDFYDIVPNEPDDSDELVEITISTTTEIGQTYEYTEQYIKAVDQDDDEDDDFYDIVPNEPDDSDELVDTTISTTTAIVDQENNGQPKNSTKEEELEFQRTPKNHTARENKGFTIPCHTNLKGVDITWELESGEALDEKKYRVQPEGLHIVNVTRNDAQVYKCRAHHVASGNIIYENITLDVHHKPYQTYAEEEEVYVFLDEPVNLTCEVEANPPPIFEWDKKMGKAIQVSDYISVLQLNVTKETPGTFKCVAYNTVGDLEKYFDVQLGEHPDMPTNIVLVKAENDKLQLKVEVPDIPYRARDPVMDPQWIVLEYRPESESEWSSMEFNITDSIVLTGLSKNTKYTIQAATRNVAGLSQYSNQTIFETSAAISVHTKLSTVIYSPFILISFISLFWIA